MDVTRPGATDTACPVATYRFEGFVLDIRRGSLLTAAGEEVPLRRQSFELLRLLVENAGRLLDRDTINRAIWSDVAVTDDSMTQCVRDIRRAIGDDAQRILKTVLQARLPVGGRRRHRARSTFRPVIARSGAAGQTVHSWCCHSRT